MRRRCPGPSLGLICLAAGVVVLLSLILPASFWWFALGAALTCAGIVMLLKW